MKKANQLPTSQKMENAKDHRRRMTVVFVFIYGNFFAFHVDFAANAALKVALKVCYSHELICNCCKISDSRKPGRRENKTKLYNKLVTLFLELS